MQRDPYYFSGIFHWRIKLGNLFIGWVALTIFQQRHHWFHWRSDRNGEFLFSQLYLPSRRLRDIQGLNPSICQVRVREAIDLFNLHLLDR